MYFSFPQTWEDGQAACNPRKSGCYHRQCSPGFDEWALTLDQLKRQKLVLLRPDWSHHLHSVYLVFLCPAPVCRLCYVLLHSCEAVWCQREEQHLFWGGGVCAVHCQMLSAFHHLQQSPLCLPEALEIWRPKGIRKGIYIFIMQFTNFHFGNIIHPCIFPQARNIAVCIEFRDSDDEDAASLKVKVGRNFQKKSIFSYLKKFFFLYLLSASMGDLEDPCLPIMPSPQYYITSKTPTSTTK